LFSGRLKKPSVFFSKAGKAKSFMSEGRAPTGVDMRSRLRILLQPGVEALGFELVDAELAGGGRGATLRVYIDSPQGITVEDCADVSRQISAILDVEDPIQGSYTLEVSSPGLDRPLVTPEDFRKRLGETVKAKLRRPDPMGRRNFSGKLLEVKADSIVLEVDNEQHELAFEVIERARLVPKF
jgi:ribosome maturation factor RimP